MILAAEEAVVRAICNDKFDGERVSPSVFVGENVSVSRLGILSFEDLWTILAEEVSRPPERILKRLAKTTVSEIETVGSESDPPFDLKVHAAPPETNPAHAEIRPRMTRGQANRLLKRVEYLELAESSN